MDTNVPAMSATPNAELIEYRMNAFSWPTVMSPFIASNVPYQNVTPSTTVVAAMSAPLNNAPDHPYRISTSNALSTAREKCVDSSCSRANARTVRMAPSESSATAVASAKAVCVSFDKTRKRRPCAMATKMSGGNAAMTTNVNLYEVENMNARPITAVAKPLSAIDRFCVATFFNNAVSAVSREMRLPEVTESKNATSCARMLVKSRLRRRATTLYDAVLNR
mmetsp:Transcript_7427/g.31643  ORF Transcript_7427/g.31643 Transcript_7427/m.31643 type:complete len:222 (-) Transcript_7427:540-1205(-)